MASLNGIDRTMPDPGPDCGTYEVNTSSFDGAIQNSGSKTSIFKSNKERFLPTRKADATESHSYSLPMRTDPDLMRHKKRKGRNVPKVTIGREWSGSGMCGWLRSCVQAGTVGVTVFARDLQCMIPAYSYDVATYISIPGTLPAPEEFTQHQPFEIEKQKPGRQFPARRCA
jgi:hypothetical protein